MPVSYMNKTNDILICIFKLILIELSATMLGMVFANLGFPETNVVVIYLLAVLLTARFTGGYYYGILSAIFSMLAYNYFFTEPYYSLSVNDSSYLITFAIMLLTSVLTSALTTKEILLTKQANERGLENKTLYMLSSKLSDASELDSVLRIATESIGTLLECNIGCIYLGNISDPLHIQFVDGKTIHRLVANGEELSRKYLDLREEYIDEADAYCFPVNGREHLLAIIRIDKKVKLELLNRKKRLLHSIIENVSMAIDRIEISDERNRDHEDMEKERERANLLRAISHDLRTPLSGIMGTSEMLMSMTDKDDQKQKLYQDIYKDADWLKSLVENILSLTRLQDGKIVIHKEKEAIEEIIASSVTHIERSYPGRNIQVIIPDDFKLVPMDGKLIEQVITNLLDNAVKHTKDVEAIIIEASYENDKLIVKVKDEGEGLEAEDIPNIFKIFYTSKSRSSDVRRGIGLGLTICETVIKAHGGTITCKNNLNGKGAEFSFALPLDNEGRNHV